MAVVIHHQFLSPSDGAVECCCSMYEEKIKTL